MKVLSNSLAGATRVKDSQGMSKSLSKVIALGQSYRLFFPVVSDEMGNKDILIAAVPGRKLNYNKLNRSFITLKDFDMTETGRIIDNSGLAPYAKISRILHDAECEAEKSQAENEARKTAEQMGKDIDKIALKTRLNEIEQKYHGNMDAKQPVYAEESPLISGVVIEVATEALVVPLKANKEPEWSKAVTASVPISGRKGTQLTNIITNPDYFDGSTNYLEVDYSYIGESKKKAGADSVFNTVSKEISLKSKFPELWEANAETQLARLAKTGEIIAARNMSMSSNTTVKEVVELFKKYVSKHEIILLHLNFEDDLVKSAAKDIVASGIVADAPRVQERLLALIQTTDVERINIDADNEVKEGIVEASSAETLMELQENVPNIEDLVLEDLEIDKV